MRNHRQFVRRGLTGVAGALLVLGVTGGFAAAQAAPASTTLPNSQSFSFNNTTQYFTVPAGVTSLQVTGWGGAGGNGGAGAGVTAAPGGLGAEITTTAPVSPGDTLVVMLGGQGASDNPDLEESGTFNAGGLSSGDAMNGGAGATGLYDSPTWGGGGGGGGTAVIDANSGAVILAAGGGGGGGGDGANYGGPGGAGGNGITAVQGGAGSGNGAGGGGSFASSGSAAGTDGGNSEWGSDAGSGGGGGGGFDDAQLGGNGGGTGGSGGYDGGGGGGGGGAGQSYSSPTDTTVQLSNGPEANGGVTINWANPAPGITVSSSDDAAALGQSVTLTATLTPVGNTNGAIPSGTVDFFDNGSDTPIGYGVLTGSTPDVATFTASALPLGSNSITAVYFGDANFPAATSPALTQLVGHKTTLALTTKVTTVQAGQTVKVNATVKEKGAPLPTGTVNLFEYQPGGVRSRSPFATLTLAPGSNKVCFKLTTLPLGTDDLYATYVGDTDNAPSVSGTVSVTVQGVGEV